MPHIAMHGLSAVVDSRLILNQISADEVINHYSPTTLLIYIRPMLSNEFILDQVPDEAICDYLIGQGFNVEM